MRDPSLDRDRVELLTDAIEFANPLDVVPSTNLFAHDRRRGEEPEPMFPKRLKHCHILDLAGNGRLHAVGVKPLVERLSHGSVRSLQEQRGAVE